MSNCCILKDKPLVGLSALCKVYFKEISKYIQSIQSTQNKV